MSIPGLLSGHDSPRWRATPGAGVVRPGTARVQPPTPAGPLSAPRKRGAQADDYPFTAPAVRPATIRFWNSSTSRISGTEMVTEAAEMLP